MVMRGDRYIVIISVMAVSIVTPIYMTILLRMVCISIFVPLDHEHHLHRFSFLNNNLCMLTCFFIHSQYEHRRNNNGNGMALAVAHGFSMPLHSQTLP